jgi:thiol-disulfide isomerase/thioredoxin
MPFAKKAKFAPRYGGLVPPFYDYNVIHSTIKMKALAILFTLTLTAFLGCDVMGMSNDTIDNIPEGVVIIDKIHPIKSFSELTEYFKGRAFFIDNWAPWCSPCLEEFNYIGPLHDFLEEQNIEIVYLNSDRDIEMEEWVDLIKKHNLNGYHLRESWDLKYDMKEKGIDSQCLPQYLIVDSKGQVLEKNTLRPSAGSELFKQIESLLDL